MKKSLLVLSLLIPLVLNADKASTWVRIGPPAGEIQQILPDRRNPDVWYAINQGILYRSENRAQTWKPSSLENVFFIAVHPVTSSIFAISGDSSFESSNLWASTDGGKTFQLRASFNYRLEKVILHPSKPEILYGLAPHGVLIVSGNGGQLWSRCELPVFDSEYDPVLDDLLISPLDQHTLYLSLTLWGYSDYDNGNFLLRSSNDGRSWKVEMKNWGSYSIAFHTDPLFPGKAFAILKVADENLAEVLRLTQGGWLRISKTKAFDKLFSVARHEKELLALSGMGSVNVSVSRSLNEGQTWEPVRIPEFLSPIMDLATLDDPLRGILLGTKDGGHTM